jgi:hypothetical protein
MCLVVETRAMTAVSIDWTHLAKPRWISSKALCVYISRSSKAQSLCANGSTRNPASLSEQRSRPSIEIDKAISQLPNSLIYSRSMESIQTRKI